MCSRLVKCVLFYINNERKSKTPLKITVRQDYTKYRIGR